MLQQHVAFKPQACMLRNNSVLPWNKKYWATVDLRYFSPSPSAVTGFFRSLRTVCGTIISGTNQFIYLFLLSHVLLFSVVQGHSFEAGGCIDYSWLILLIFRKPKNKSSRSLSPKLLAWSVQIFLSVLMEINYLIVWIFHAIQWNWQMNMYQASSGVLSFVDKSKPLFLSHF